MKLLEAKNQVIKDFRGRFIINDEQIQYLVQEMNESLHSDNPEYHTKTTYIFGLMNGLLSQVDTLDELLQQKNDKQNRIIFLLIETELIDKEGEVVRRYLMHFGTGSKPYQTNELILSNNELFNLNFEGISYRILDSNRTSALNIMQKLDKRVQSYFRWYSKINLNSIPKLIAYCYLLFAFMTINLITSATIIKTAFPIYSKSIILSSMLIMLALLLLKAIGSLIPPSYFVIGQGKKAYQNTFQSWRQLFWAVPIPAIVGFLVNKLSQ